MNDLTSDFLLPVSTDPVMPRRLLGDLLIEAGVLKPHELVLALAEHRRLDVPLGQVLVAEGRITEPRLFDILARQRRWRRADLATAPADPQLTKQVSHAVCRDLRVLPWKTHRGVTYLACESSEAFANATKVLEHQFGLMAPALASDREILQGLTDSFPAEAADMAATCLPRDQSCRALAEPAMARWMIAAGLILMAVAAVWLWPATFAVALTGFAILMTIGNSLAKFTAFLAHFFPKAPSEPLPESVDLPCISVMVPLHREPDIALALVTRLSRLEYPRALLDILLVVEQNDSTTRAALALADLPPWMQAVVVPDGDPKTKPRALNHALPFCRGEIIGIYDAEDAPEPGQLLEVAHKFHTAPPDVACVQGVLEFYNPRDNWLARCFSLDYASWFRVILPGWSRLGLAVPLGGTTLFLRRAAIEQLHGWDAHNVTEDADLGLRLARAGFRTVLMASATGEEANCHAWRWIRQRSRWIKGYMVTYWAHMRSPLGLIMDIGLWPFLGFQLMFLGTVTHFFTAPVLWAFWLAALGLTHPVYTALPSEITLLIAPSFFLSEVLGMVVLATASIRAKRLFLLPWIPTMMFYYLLAVPAGLKAAWEFVRAPVFWDKTDHGHSLPPLPEPIPASQTASRSASDFNRVTKALEICDFNAS